MMPTPKQLMKRYRKYRGLVYSISAAYAAAWGCEVAEPMSLALVLFCDSCWRYDRGKCGSFRKYLNYRLRLGLADEQKRRVRRARLLRQVDMPDDLPWFQREFDLKEFLEALSEDARVAVRLALSTGGTPNLSRTGGSRARYKGGTGGVVTRERLENILRTRRGWTRARSRQAFDEIRRALP